MVMLSVLATAILSSSGVAAAAAAQTVDGTTPYTSAAQEFAVPVGILMAISYNETHWQATAGPSIDGGYGPMGLRTYVPVTVSGRDGGAVVSKAQAVYPLDTAASLLGVSPEVLKVNNQQNIRGAAALLADYQRQQSHGQLSTNPADWYGAVAAFSGANDATVAASYADSVYTTMSTGASTTTPAGRIKLGASPIVPNKPLSTPSLGHSTTPEQAAECPAQLNCRFIPAAYAQDDPNDPTNYGNYDPAHRPRDMKINYIFIHDTEGSYESAIAHFQDPTSYVSSQYVVRSSDGAVTQMVANSDVSWGAYDWYDNMHGINIENEGFAAQGASWFTPAMYQTNAALVRYLAQKYNIPLDRQHILGHDNAPVIRPANFVNQHWDPGPYWDWDYFMALVQGKTPQQAAVMSTQTIGSDALKTGDTVTVAPHFATNQPVVTDCQTGTCLTLPAQGTNFVYLRAQPQANAALLSDPYLHPDNSPGTTLDSDWGNKAPSGFKYVVASTQGDWTGVWYSGKIGWIYNPHGANAVLAKTHSATIAPKSGLASIGVYGAAYPETAAYPADVPVQQLDPLFTIAAGQKYATSAQDIPTDYFYDATIDSSLPDDHLIVKGGQKYYQIIIGHRIGYVKANEVKLIY